MNDKIIELSNIEIYEHCILNIRTGEKEYNKKKNKYRILQGYISKTRILFLQYTLLNMDL